MKLWLIPRLEGKEKLCESHTLHLLSLHQMTRLLSIRLHTIPTGLELETREEMMVRKYIWEELLQ